jgi:histidinol dehydrogenase
MLIKPLREMELQAEVAALRPSEESGRAVAERVASILASVRARGDAAVVDATARFDWPGATAGDLEIPVADLDIAYNSADPLLLEALRTARDNCTFFHRHELRPDWEGTGPQGQTLGIRHLPVERAGLYVPGGLGAYASTVVMNAVPALVAGVGEVVVCTPPGPDGKVNDSVLTATRLMGITRLFRVGGAQAIAAMAFGTETIPRVDVISGPGNAYVMEAKRQVYGSVGIDGLAGPSEVLVVAVRTARPEWIATDMLAQEEHGSGAEALLLAESLEVCEEVEKAIVHLEGERRRGSLATGMAEDSAASGSGRLWAFYPAPGEDFFRLAAALVDTYAPEHLEIQAADPRAFLSRVHSAGAIFLGHGTPTVFGDYIAGSNHVLPTGGSARFSSPLSVDTFIRKSSYVEVPAGAGRLLTPPLARIADSEGFFFHRLSAESRVEGG